MQRQDLVAYCLAKPDATEHRTNTGNDVEIKVAGQAFAIFGPEHGTVTLKCGQDGEESAVWRETYPSDVIIAPYLGRYGWNTFSVHGGISESEFFRAVDVSYQDVLERNALVGDE